MKKIITLMMMTAVLTGCQTAKYVVDQTFPDKNEYQAYQTQTVPQDNLVAATDEWIKRHLW